MADMKPQGVVGRGFTEVKFNDQFGEERTIYKNKGSTLRVKKREDSPSHLLNRAAAKLMGAKIKAARISAGLSQSELIHLSGLTFAGPNAKQRMYEIENGGNPRSTPNNHFQGVRFGTLYALALALGIEARDLMPSAKEVQIAAGVSFEISKPRLAKSA